MVSPEFIDKLRCKWSGDSCQDILHFTRERLARGDGFDAAHQKGLNDESKYRKEKGLPGAKLNCLGNAAGTAIICTYDDNGDGIADRSETLNLDGNNNYTSVNCVPP